MVVLSEDVDGDNWDDAIYPLVFIGHVKYTNQIKSRKIRHIVFYFLL